MNTAVLSSTHSPDGQGTGDREMRLIDRGAIDFRKTRRRVEDALRKGPRENILKVAELLGIDPVLSFPKMKGGVIKALELAISSSSDASPFARKSMIWMLRQTDNLTIPVTVFFPSEYHYKGQEAAFGIHDMNSMNRRARLDLFLRGMGTFMMFHSFSTPNTNGEEDGHCGFQLQISSEFSEDERAKVLTLDMEAIEAVELIV